MRHPFYDRTPSQQRAFKAQVIGVMLGVMVAVGGAALTLDFYALLVLLPLPLQVAAQFIDPPSGRASGALVYYAPLFIVERHRGGDLSLHGGTLLDYWFVLRGPMSAEQRRRRVLLDYVRGLIALARAHAESKGPSFELRATTYFLSPSTARRAGFEPQPLSAGAVLLWVNVVPLTLSYSLLHRRVRVPPLHRARSYRAPIESLVASLTRLEALEARLAAAFTTRSHDAR